MQQYTLHTVSSVTENSNALNKGVLMNTQCPALPVPCLTEFAGPMKISTNASAVTQEAEKKTLTVVLFTSLIFVVISHIVANESEVMHIQRTYFHTAK